MKQAIGFTLAALVIFALVPLLARGSAAPAPITAFPTGSTEAEPSGTEALQPPEVQGFDETFFLPVLEDGIIRSTSLHAYLTGVLLAEMPMDFADEALKAQAVACRTYTLRGYLHRRHDPAAVCTDSHCCQGWKDPDAVPEADRLRAEAAVAATDGLVIRWEGELIDATFFSCSGGRTESAAAVWGREVPYLQSVDSPGEEAAAHFTDVVRISLEDFCALLQAEDPEVRFPDRIENWIGTVRSTPGGGVADMEIGGRTFTGRALRKLFGLRSTAFSLTLEHHEAVFETRGYGHRVGMSQWGAQAMAKAGSQYTQILTHYYTGVSVEPFDA